MRPADLYDIEPIMHALLYLQEKAAGRGQMKYTDAATARTYIRERVHAVRIVIEEGYAIMFDIGAPWYSKQEFLIEELIIKVYPTQAPVAVAIAVLERLSRLYTLPAVVAGDTQVGYMIPHYHAAGYTTLGTQLIKEILPNGIRPQDHRSSSTD